MFSMLIWLNHKVCITKSVMIFLVVDTFLNISTYIHYVYFIICFLQVLSKLLFELFSLLSVSLYLILF